MHLYPRRRNVATQVAGELKTVTYATPRMEERRKKKKESSANNASQCHNKSHQKEYQPRSKYVAILNNQLKVSFMNT